MAILCTTRCESPPGCPSALHRGPFAFLKTTRGPCPFKFLSVPPLIWPNGNMRAAGCSYIEAAGFKAPPPCPSTDHRYTFTVAPLHFTHLYAVVGLPEGDDQLRAEDHARV